MFCVQALMDMEFSNIIYYQEMKDEKTHIANSLETGHFFVNVLSNLGLMQIFQSRLTLQCITQIIGGEIHFLI